MPPAAEDLALIAACSTPRAGLRAESIRNLATEITDWERFAVLAEEHSVLPLVDDALRSTDARIPNGAREMLQMRVELAAVNGLHGLRTASRACSLLAERAIDAVPFKGPTLALLLYESVTMRSSTDVDLLVSNRDALVARRVLEEEGYRFWIDLDPSEEARYLRYGNEYTLTASDGSILELCWSLAPRAMCLDVDVTTWLRHRANLVTQVGSFGILRSEEYLVALAVHGSKHRWERVGWVADIAQMLDVVQIDFRRALSLARQQGIERPLLLALLLARELAGDYSIQCMPSLPREMPSEVQAMVRQVHEGWRTRAPSEPDPLVDRFLLRLHRSPMRRLQQIYRLAFTPTVEDWRFVKLPPKLRGLYPIFRPVRLALKYGSQVGRSRKTASSRAVGLTPEHPS